MEENRRGEGTMAESNKKESNALENRGQRLQQTQSLPQLQPGGTTPGDRWARDRLWYNIPTIFRRFFSQFSHKSGFNNFEYCSNRSLGFIFGIKCNMRIGIIYRLLLSKRSVDYGKINWIMKYVYSILIYKIS